MPASTSLTEVLRQSRGNVMAWLSQMKPAHLSVDTDARLGFRGLGAGGRRVVFSFFFFFGGGGQVGWYVVVLVFQFLCVCAVVCVFPCCGMLVCFFVWEFCCFLGCVFRGSM